MEDKNEITGIILPKRVEEPVEPTPPSIIAERKSYAFKTTVVYLMYAIGLIITLYGLLYMFIGSPADLKNALKLNAQLEKKIDSLKTDNTKIDSKLMVLGRNQIMFVNMIETNNQLMQKNNEDLKNFRNVFNKKINNVDTYTISELDSFFRKRYQQFYDNQ